MPSALKFPVARTSKPRLLAARIPYAANALLLIFKDTPLMEKTLTLENFYRTKLGILPSEIVGRVGQFNVFSLEDYVGNTAYPMPYSRKDYFKISLITGKNRVYYADKTLEVADNMLLFANPQIPYNWEPLQPHQEGAFCVFTDAFFHGYGNIKEYPLFQPEGTPVLSLQDDEVVQIRQIYQKMFQEIASDYTYKYDVLRNLVSELIHTALQLRPAQLQKIAKSDSNASDRITALFLELVERQFPIESTAQRIHFRTPGEFANQLNVHINHLNKVLKESTGKTTSQLLAERLTQEARAMLKHTHWNIAEIGWSLGFDDPSHFIKFFKKNTQTTPTGFRG